MASLRPMQADRVLPDARNYDALVRDFRWRVPDRYNIGVDVCDRWADVDPRPARFCIVACRHPDGAAARDQLWVACARHRTGSPTGCAPSASSAATGSAIMLPQAPEVAAAHVAIYKLAAVALPLAILFGVDALSHRLHESPAPAR